ncbi:hypothetical protein [Bradyrhizobium cenepequi]
MAFFVIVAFSPFALILYFRKRAVGLTLLGLMVCSCLALSLTTNAANVLRSATQAAIDNEIALVHSDRVEGVMRPLVGKIVEGYVSILGDDKSGRGTTRFTYLAIDYMFNSASLLAAFALATFLLSPTASWLCLFMVAFFAQAAIDPNRMGAVFLAGGFFWQLFLLASGRNIAAIVSGLVICFWRTDVVFATAFGALGLAWADGKWPSQKQWATFGLLILTSIAVPKILLLLHPNADYSSFLVTNGDFSKTYGNYRALKLALGIASPALIVIIATTAFKLSRVAKVVLPPALIHLLMVFLIADFTETRLLGPALGGLAFLCSERLAALLEQPPGESRRLT